MAEASVGTLLGSRPWLKNYPPDVPATLTYREVPLYALLADAAAAHPGLVAIHSYNAQLTYAELWAQAQRFAAVLAESGVRQGDRVALMLPNCPQYVIAYFGTLRAGGVVAQVNPLYTPRELEYLLRDSGAEIIVIADVLAPALKAVSVNLRHVVVATLKGDVPLDAGARQFERLLAETTGPPPDVSIEPRADVAALQYTGGTTGTSKAAMLTHFNLLANVRQTQ